MAEYLLDDAQVSATGKHVSGKRVSQCMRVQVVDANGATSLCHDLVN